MTEPAEVDAPASGSAPALLTFLIADVRGYTTFTNEHGDEAGARLADRFAELCQTVVEAHGGKVIELRGDEALCVFSSARNALRAAVALQGAFRESVAEDPSLPLSVGIGIDAGEAVPVRGGYRGGALNLAARLCSIAAAGEILTTETVTGLSRRTDELIFVDRGPVTLKGLSDAVRVLQIGQGGELADELPPLQPILAEHPTNLPDEPTPFIGRQREIEEIVQLFREPHVRLVTLTGPGGTGKTRLALQVGGSLLYDFEDGVFLVSLAPLTDPALVPSAIATALAVKEEGETSLTEQLIEHLREKQLLLILDNFEHLLDACETVASLLDGCRELHILVTSRIPLHLARENEYPVAPLAVPDLRQLPSPTQLTQYDSVALFIQRAGAVRPGFAVTNENAPAVAEICAQLDGLPLAIELAAARTKLFPPQALLQRLSSRLTLLSGGARDRPTRQQTLRGAIDWSYALLTPEEQTFFARFSVFAGGCTFEAAEAVCNPDGAADVLEGLSSLVDKSLLRQEGDADTRFMMLETIREYAAEKLQAPDAADELRGAHATYFHDLAQRAQPELEGAGQESWLPLLDAELPNIRAAMRWLLDHEQNAEAVEIATALFTYWQVRGHWQESIEWFETVQGRSDSLPPAVRGWTLWGLAAARISLGEFPAAQRESEQGLAIFREIGDERGICRTLLSLGIVTHQNSDESVRYLQESSSLARGKDPWAASSALMLLGNTLLTAGRLSEAGTHYEEGLQLVRKRGDRFGATHILVGLGEIARVQGKLDEALDRFDEALAIGRALSAPQTIAASLVDRGVVFMEEGRYEEAAEGLAEGLRLTLELGDQLAIQNTLSYIGDFVARTGDFERAAHLFAAASSDEFGSFLALQDRERIEGAVATTRDQLAPEVWDRAWKEGQSMALDEAVAYAMESLSQSR